MHQSIKQKQREKLGSMTQLKISISGAVQGVGFRPFIFRSAMELGLAGWVKNTSQGVFIDAEGSLSSLKVFLSKIESAPPPHAHIKKLQSSYHKPVGYKEFKIISSDEKGEKNVFILPDIAVCDACLEDIFDSKNRRYLYPFTNCTNCGPRFSIISDLPYDRQSTTMMGFKMCDLCRAEYENPLDRRFHAQPNACPVCGPHLELWNNQGECLKRDHSAFLFAIKAIRDGKIVALKGIGGFHLMVNASDAEAVNRLRVKKGRKEKPFALMLPSLEMVEEVCYVSSMEKEIITSPESPIVLLKRKDKRNSNSAISSAAAPLNPFLGIMLPYSPLHHMLMTELGFPIIATSGNLANEPICIDENEAIKRLSNIADLFLVNNRPIARHVDDSIVRVVLNRELILRRARGYAPLPVELINNPVSTLAVGANQKNTFAISIGTDAFLSQHMGDLNTVESYDSFSENIKTLQKLYNFKPERMVCDLHPDYLSTQYAKNINMPLSLVQHHHGHILSCMAENQLKGPVLGVCWDGTGYGPDNTIWGGEFLKVTSDSFERIAHFRTFSLPGSDMAVKESRRAAIGILYEIYGDSVFNENCLKPLLTFKENEKKLLHKMLDKGFNCPRTSSAGRIFDACASILGIRHINNFEGQAAMELEFLTMGIKSNESYSYTLNKNGQFIIDWEPMIRDIFKDLEDHTPFEKISVRIHNTLAEIIISLAQKNHQKKIVLTGGCFQNCYLLERTVKRLRQEKYTPYWHRRIPPNDGGISLGQICAP